MPKRIALLTMLILSLVLLPGCPGAGSALVGSWVITFSNTDYGLQINANGEAIPFMLDQIFGGTFTWEVEGTRVLLHHVLGGNEILWTAELTSDTTKMTGAWINYFGAIGLSETFTAVEQ